MTNRIKHKELATKLLDESIGAYGASLISYELRDNHEDNEETHYEVIVSNSTNNNKRSYILCANDDEEVSLLVHEDFQETDPVHFLWHLFTWEIITQVEV